MQILFDHACDGCLGQTRQTLCQELCLENAVAVRRVPIEELAEEPIRLLAGEMSTCEACGNSGQV